LVVEETDLTLIALDKLCVILICEVGCIAATEVLELVALSSEDPSWVQAIRLEEDDCRKTP